jgi:hypothetical protein
MSTVKVNTVDKRTGGTLTLGGCGTTVTLGAGATQSGFGRTGTVDWCTTAKTAPFTGVSGNGYFVNTACGAVTVTLPATPTAGDIISIADYASTWSTNAVTLCRNGSLINAGSVNPSLTTTGQSITLVYVDGTRGWKNTMDSTSNVSGVPSFIVATGGTITCCGDYKIHTFTSDSTFTICSAPTPANNVVDYLVVAGGGSGGTANGGYGAGGGGAGGFRLSNSTCMSVPLTSPLASPAGLPVSVTSYPVTVGGGGAGFSSPDQSDGNVGVNSVFSTITSAGGGYGAGGVQPNTSVGGNGGSGGGGWSSTPSSTAGGGNGNTPPTSPPQGNNGGIGGPNPANGGGGGGGAGAVGGNTSPGFVGGIGGVGSYVIGTGLAGCNGTPGPVCGAKYFSGGGGGSSSPTGSPGGTGGGGKGGDGGSDPGIAGTANTGGGGGGTRAGTSGAGGSGIVIIRYKYQ